MKELLHPLQPLYNKTCTAREKSVIEETFSQPHGHDIAYTKEPLATLLCGSDPSHVTPDL